MRLRRRQASTRQSASPPVVLSPFDSGAMNLRDTNFDSAFGFFSVRAERNDMESKHERTLRIDFAKRSKSCRDERSATT
jgi:hypothetical protein